MGPRRVRGLATWVGGPALLVLALYALWLAIFAHLGFTPWDFILLGRQFNPNNPHAFTQYGYDGQFYYWIAVHPLHARPLLDNPPYRYGRILYPIMARFLALSHVQLIPYTLVAVNVLAVAGGTLAVAWWLRRHIVSPWFALAYGLYPGLLLGVVRDCTEPLSYGLVAAGVAVFNRSRMGQVLLSAGLLALASLARETALIFTVLMAAAILIPRSAAQERAGQPSPAERIRNASAFLALGAGPCVLYRAVLWLWLGDWGGSPDLTPRLIPLSGFWPYWPWTDMQTLEMSGIIAPAILCLGVALYGLARDIRCPELWLVIANALLLVVMLPAPSYADIYAAGRITTGVVLAAVFALPVLKRSASTWWLWTSGTLWLSMLPFAAVVAPYSIVLSGGR